MAEYIEKGFALKSLIEVRDSFERCGDNNGRDGAEDCIAEIKYLPAADVAPVVRCEDCKHQEDCMKQLVFWERDPVLEQNVYQYYNLEFCSYGERRDSEC